MASHRMLEVTPVSAEDLKDVKLFGKMQTYVVAWVDPSRKASTNLDKFGGKNPRWNDRLMISVDERLLQQPNTYLVLEIYNKGLLESKIVGRVSIPLQEISTKASGDVPTSYKVRRPSGRFQGVVHVSVKLGEKIEYPKGNSSSSDPVVAYPYPPQSQGYPPQNQGYPAYPPQNQGYAGYPPQQQQYYPPAGNYGNYGAPMYQPPRRNRYGGGGLGGAGLGLGAGLLGGLLVGDMISDIGDNDYGGGDYGGGDYGGGDYGGGDFGGGDF